MDTIENEKRRIKERRSQMTFKSPVVDKTGKEKYVNRLIARVLLAFIVFLLGIIARNFNSTAQKFLDETVLKENMSFSKISNLYNKYFGEVIPLTKVNTEDNTVFEEKIKYNSIDKYEDGFALDVQENYLVPVINSGIIVFIGEKEGLGNTVIVQGIDEIDYWYSNVENISNSLYDYVTKGSYLGSVQGSKLYLTFKKGSEFLDYDEVVE